MSAFHEQGNEEIETRDAALRGLARRLVTSEEDVEDVVQDAWLAAMEQPQERVRNLDGWLRTVIRYKASRQRRRDAQRHRRELVVAGEREEDPGEGGDPSLAALSALGRAVWALREPYQGVVHLRYFEDLSIPQICERLTRPPATVKSQLRRALAQLRERMDREYGGERTLWRSALVFALRLDSTPFPPHAGALPPGAPAASRSPGSALAGSSTSGPGAVAWLLASAAAVAIVLAAWLLPGLADSGSKPVDVALQPPVAARGGNGDLSLASAPLEPVPARLEVEPEPAPVGPAVVFVSARSSVTDAPVADLPLLFEPVSRELVVAEEPFVERVDAEGLCSRELAAGSWRVSPLRGAPRRIEVPAAGELDVDLVVPPGAELSGLTVDPLGNPVTGARILASWPDRRDCWLPVELSDLTGSFTIVVDPAAWLYANDDGRSPSPISSVDGSAGSAEPLRLELGFPRPAIPGVVVDVDGNPIAEAVVGTAVMPSLGMQLGRDGTWWTNRVPCRTRTDAQGRFSVDRVNPSTNQIVVTAPGYTPWRGVLPAGGWPAEPMRIELPPANRIVGRVVDADGRAVSGAWIEAEQVWPFGPERELARADGSFEIAELAPGEITLRASVPGRGSAVARREIGDAETIDVQLVLGEASSVHGRASDADGEPLVGWVVLLVPSSDLGARESLPVDEVWHESPLDTTGADGSFEFLACDDVEHVAMLFPPTDRGERPRGLPHAWTANVRPGHEVVLLRLPPSASTAGSVTGALDCDPRSAGSTKMLLRSVDLNHAIVGPLDDSCAFRFQGLPAGEYELFAWRPAHAPVQVASLALRPEEERQLDLVRMPVDGALRIDVELPDGASLQDMRVQLVSRYARFQGSLRQPSSSFDIEPDGSVYVRDLPAGDYHLRLETLQFSDVYTHVHVDEGRETHEKIALERGRTFILRVTSRVPLGPNERIDFRIYPEDGSAEIPFDDYQPTVPEGPFLLAFRFPEGSYRIAASSTSGLSGEGRVELASGGPRQMAVDLALVRR